MCHIGYLDYGARMYDNAMARWGTPEGVYDIDKYSSKKFSDHFILSNEDVPKDRLILYHSGTTGDDTEGCALPGTTKGDGRIYQSRKKMEELRTFIKGRGVENVKSIFNNKISR